MVRAKYLKNDTVSSVKCKFGDSPIWKAIMKVKETYMAGRKINVNCGDLARVWHDPWLGDGVLRDRFPVLFDICQNQECTVASFVANDYELAFRRRLFGELVDQWKWIG